MAGGSFLVIAEGNRPRVVDAIEPGKGDRRVREMPRPIKLNVAGSPALGRKASLCGRRNGASERTMRRARVERRRSILLEYPEASEEVGFKGTMTLVGCVTLWGILGVFLVSLWLPWLQWTIVPILLIFLALQSFRWLARRNPTSAAGDSSESKQPA